LNKVGYEPSEVSAVVCTWDAENIIEECLDSLRNNGVGEIIVVDADSDDRTREIASRFTNKILTDPREGLAQARNMGINRAKGKYILNFGSDNVLPDGTLNKMLKWLVEKKYSGVSAITHLKYANRNYLASAMDLYKKARYYPGERQVIGTPTLFHAKLQKEFPYDRQMGWADDADLCDRLVKQGHSFAVSDAIVWEIGSENIRSVVYRWKGCGRSDWEVYKKYASSWPFRRKLWSLTHPLRVESITPFLRSRGWSRFYILPFLLLITEVRYFSWAKHAIFGLDKK